MGRQPAGNSSEPRSGPVRAAEYVRMSTDHQRYSAENQSAAIRRYAEARGIEIVRTYADHGKSGLSIAGRAGLQRLLDDVRSGRADFSVILVYDVSRWGRFQDADESAFYEYQCRRAGISVEYCIDGFENDGSPVATIVKGVKRALAGESSRLLSVRVFAGQCRLIELGFRQGGPAGYGLRRRLVDGAGASKGDLSRGEQKSIQTDRVVLVPGPPEEVETVRWIYRAFVEEGRPEREIADILNGRGIRTDLGRPWTRGTVHQVLINEKYAGDNVWNRVSCKLQGARMRNGRDMWVRRDGAVEAVVDRLLFDAAQVIIHERCRRLTDEEMLEALRRLLARRGYLSGLVIDEADETPSSGAYQSRFGSLLRAVEVGQIPVSVAVEIAEAEDADVQQVLHEAYERNLLRGQSLLAAKRLIEVRRSQGRRVKPADGRKARPLSVDVLVRTYRQDVDKKRLIVRDAAATRGRLLFVVEALRALMADEGFVTLLRAEGLLTMPAKLAERVGSSAGGG